MVKANALSKPRPYRILHFQKYPNYNLLWLFLPRLDMFGIGKYTLARLFYATAVKQFYLSYIKHIHNGVHVI